MTIYSHHFQSEFTWRTTPHGLPIAEAVKVGDNIYTKCCPACGGFHVVKVAARVRPNCTLRSYADHDSARNLTRTLWQRMIERWLECYPQAAGLMYISVQLVPLYEGQPVNPDAPALDEKPKRSRGGRKVAVA